MTSANGANDPWWVTPLVILLVAPIIVGPLLAFVTGNPAWLHGLWFLVFFLS